MANPVTTGVQFRDAMKRLLASLDSTGDSNTDKYVGTRRWRMTVASVTAGGSLEVPFEILDVPVQVTSVKVLPNSALTSNNTDFATLTLEFDDGAGGSKSTIATANTANAAGGGTGNWSAAQAQSLAITSANASVASGKQLLFKVAQTANGVATPILTLYVDAVLV